MKKIFYTLEGALLVWFIASYLDIISHNLASSNYAWWNLIDLIF